MPAKFKILLGGQGGVGGRAGEAGPGGHGGFGRLVHKRFKANMVDADNIHIGVFGICDHSAGVTRSYKFFKKIFDKPIQCCQGSMGNTGLPGKPGTNGQNGKPGGAGPSGKQGKNGRDGNLKI